MALELPPLPYAYDALQPYMSKETLEFHHDKHHQAYVTNGNNLLKDSGLEGKSVEEICKAAWEKKNQGLINNVGQHYNHVHFWKWMKKGGGGKKLPGKIAKAVDGDLGGYDKMRTDFVQAGMTQFGSGWAWLAVKDGKLAVMKTPNGENPLMHGASPVLGCRRLGAFLLHRLPQRPAEVPRGFRRQPRQLGSRRGNVQQRQVVGSLRSL